MTRVRRGHLAIPLLLALPAAGHAPAQEACTAAAAMVTDIGRVAQVGAMLPMDKLFRPPIDTDHGKLRYLRVLLTVRATGAAPGKWQLTIRDALLRPVETFSSSEHGAQSSFWTRRLDAQQPPWFDLKGQAGTEIEIRQMIVMPGEARNTYYSLQKEGVTRFVDLAKAEAGRRHYGDATGMLMASFAGRSWCCSGVAIGENRFLTNWHCGAPDNVGTAADVWNPDVCANTIIDMSWDGDAQDREYVCKRVQETSAEKDYAILEIAPRNGKDALRPPPLRSAPVASAEHIVIVHHPACRPKQVSLGCKVVAGRHPNLAGTGTSSFTHDCDTEAGSSGAAVFDLQGRLVGIHNFPFEKHDGVCDMVNKGVHIGDILALPSPP